MDIAAGPDASNSTPTTVVFLFRSCAAILARMSDQHDDSLAFDIAFARSRRRKALRRTPTHNGVEHGRLLAKAVNRHLKLCDWRLEKKPPMKAHTSGRSA